MQPENADFKTRFEEWKRTSFSQYCINICKSTCCDMREVGITVSRAEINRMYGRDVLSEDSLMRRLKYGIQPTNNEEYFYCELDDYCPSFDRRTRMCKIYESRPRSCSRYPFKDCPEDTVLISKGCMIAPPDPVYEELEKLAAEYGKKVVKAKPEK
jgi:Fe-S-cluster containining protein